MAKEPIQLTATKSSEPENQTAVSQSSPPQTPPPPQRAPLPLILIKEAWWHSLVTTTILVLLLTRLIIYSFEIASTRLDKIQDEIMRLKEAINIQELQKNKPTLNHLVYSYTVNAGFDFSRAQLLSTLWLKLMGFVTGMGLTFAGAFFILGKIVEPQGQAQAGAQIGGGNLKPGDQEKIGTGAWVHTAYPGLIMIFFGTIVIVLTIYVAKTVEWSPGTLLPEYTGMADPKAVENTKKAIEAAIASLENDAKTFKNKLKVLEEDQRIPKATANQAAQGNAKSP